MPLLEYSSVGGIAGGRERLVVFPDGRARRRIDEDVVETELEPLVVSALRQALGPQPFQYRSEIIGCDIPDVSYVYRPGGRRPPPMGPVSRYVASPIHPTQRGSEFVQLLFALLDHLVVYRSPEGNGATLGLAINRDGRAQLARTVLGRAKFAFPETRLVGRPVTLGAHELERLCRLLAEAGFPRRAYEPELSRATDRYQVVHRFLVAEAEAREALALPPCLVEELEAISLEAATAEAPR